MLRLEDLFVLKTGQPKQMDDCQWQICFRTMKQLNYKTPLQKYMPRYLPDVGSDGYAEFLNSVLFNLREGEIDYCTKLYHITDLLKLEGNDLQSEYLPEEKCFKVWLEVS